MEGAMIRAAQVFAAFFLMSMVICAQTAQIQGIVQDSSDAAVPGAEIKATQIETGAVRVATSAGDGVYVIPELPVGPYRLEVTKPGFASYIQTGIVLQVATNPTVDIRLKVGAVSEQVQVEANAALVETATTSIGQVIDNQRILDLPLNGRQVTDLIQLTGATVSAGVTGTGGIPGGVYLSVAGGQTFGVGYFLDGLLYAAGDSATNYPFPFPDALQEFKVETSSMGAQNGQKSGAAINAVTKSGTNTYHGDVFEFLRNGDLNARNFFAASRDSLKRNQYGGVIGGPIKRNKLFFFAGYQATRVRQDPTATPAFVPTAQMLTGDWTDFASAACNGGKALTLGGPFAGNKVSPELFNSASLQIVKTLPAASDPCGRTVFGAVSDSNEHQIIGKIDYQINEKHTLFGRYNALILKGPPAYGLSHNILSTIQNGYDNLFQSYSLGETWLIGPTLVNSFRLGVLRAGVHRFNDDFFSGCDLGVQMYCTVPHQSIFAVTNGFNINAPSGSATPNSPTTTTYVANNDVNMVRGAHQFSLGISAWYNMSNNRANVYSEGTFTFNGLVTGSGLADFILGDLGAFSQGNPNVGFSRKWYLGLYGADTWKVSPRLTVNIGLRWEPSFPTIIANGNVYTFDPNAFLQGTRSQVFTNAPPGVFYSGDAGVPYKTGVNPVYTNFAPRLGLSWDPTGGGKTSIRAAFGTNYDTTGGNLANATQGAPPWGNVLTQQGPLPFLNPYANNPGGNPFPGCGGNPCGRDTAFVSNGTYIAVQPTSRFTTVYTWNFGVQRQIAGNWLISASYAGSATSHLWTTHQLNPGTLFPGVPNVATCGATATNANCVTNLPLRRLFTTLRPSYGPQIGFMDQFDSGGTANYNGLILSVQRRLSRGMAVSANYTWSHCIGDVTQAAGVTGAGSGYSNLTNRRFDRANCASQQIAGNFGTDRRQIFNLTAVLESPTFSNKKWRAIGSGWKLSPIFRASTGGYLTIGLSTDRYLQGGTAGNQRPVQVLEDPLCANPNPSCWINPAAFALPALGTLGNMGKYNVIGPGFWQLDSSLSRIFAIREKIKLEARWEAFNLTNSFHAGVPSGLTTGLLGVNATFSGSGNFGQITSALDPRIMQVAMKVVF
jgi:hypothetical protein